MLSRTAVCPPIHKHTPPATQTNLSDFDTTNTAAAARKHNKSVRDSLKIIGGVSEIMFHHAQDTSRRIYPIFLAAQKREHLPKICNSSGTILQAFSIFRRPQQPDLPLRARFVFTFVCTHMRTRAHKSPTTSCVHTSTIRHLHRNSTCKNHIRNVSRRDTPPTLHPVTLS